MFEKRWYIRLAVLEWLVRLLNVSGSVTTDWRGACIVRVYTGKVTNMNAVTREV